MAGGRVNFVFFSSPEADIAFGNIVMAPGTSRSQTDKMLKELEAALIRAESKVTDGEGGLIEFHMATLGRTLSDNPDEEATGAMIPVAGLW